MPMNEHVYTEAFGQAEKLEQLRSIVDNCVAVSRASYFRAAATALDGAKGLTELADAKWSSTKMLNDKIVQNATANAEAAFDAAQALAGAKSFAEVATIQSEFVQQLTARAVAQSREFVDLSARAAEHVIETAHAAASRSLKAGF
jgi:hypothetical protein